MQKFVPHRHEWIWWISSACKLRGQRIIKLDNWTLLLTLFYFVLLIFAVIMHDIKICWSNIVHDVKDVSIDRPKTDLGAKGGWKLHLWNDCPGQLWFWSCQQGGQLRLWTSPCKQTTSTRLPFVRTNHLCFEGWMQCRKVFRAESQLSTRWLIACARELCAEVALKPFDQWTRKGDDQGPQWGIQHFLWLLGFW